MKNLLIVLCCFAGSLASAHEDQPDTGTIYSIISSKRDSTLKEKEAVFIFHFSRDWQRLQKFSFPMSANGKGDEVHCDTNGTFVYKTQPGKYSFMFYYTNHYYEVYTQPIEILPGYRVEVQVNFRNAAEFNINSDKPVIYLYPDHTMPVHVTLQPNGNFDFTYPPYKSGWDITANPDGTLDADGKKYNYLFWDGKLKMDLDKMDISRGSVISKDSLVPFFERKLGQMGLSPQEQEDFITYWVPRMKVNEWNYVHFMFNEEYDTYAHLEVTPAPDKIFRVFMMWSKMEGKSGIQHSEQQIPAFSRSGFTVVEWGGGEMEYLPEIFYR